MSKLVRGLGLLLCAALLSTSCTGEQNRARVYKAHFTRAVQLFPGVKVKVLGVDVGRVLDVRNIEGAVEVTFRIEDDSVEIPAGAKAAIVPESLLGERYIQLLPAYSGGQTLPEGSTIPLERTAVPAEGDELLAALQDYLGALDPKTLERFVTNAAEVLQGRGQEINSLIGHGTEVLRTLSVRRDEIAALIVQFNTLTQSLATRQDAIAALLRNYDTVGTTITEVRQALEGTIQGLADASAELAGLLIDHRDPLAEDIEALTKTTRTLVRNIDSFARTGHWAKRLFKAASQAVDYERDWLRLGNQGGPLVELILARLQDRLVGLCLRLGVDECASLDYWAKALPHLFCYDGAPACDGLDLRRGLQRLGGEIGRAVKKVRCKDAEDPRACRREKKQREEEAQGIGELIEDILDGGLIDGGLLGGAP